MPYIDVMLVLLVIFMVTAPLLTEGVKVDLVQADARQIDSNEVEPVILSVDDEGKYFIDKEAKEPEQWCMPWCCCSRLGFPALV